MWGLALADVRRDARSSDSLTGIVFSKKLFTKFPGLATSGCHNSAMTTDRRKFTAKWSLYWMSSFRFYRLNEFSLSPVLYVLVQERYLPKFSATSDVRYCILKP